MQRIDDVIVLAKKLLVKQGGLDPTILFVGTRGTEMRPLPDAEVSIKLSLCEGLGYAVAKENRIGELTHLFFLSEGWRSSAPYTTGLTASQPRYDPNRVEVLMVFHSDLTANTKRMVLYDELRDKAGSVTELRALTEAGSEGMEAESAPMEAVIRGFARGRAVAHPVDDD